MIKVQPMSIARRSAKVTKGSKRLLAGRPLLGEKTTVKKKTKPRIEHKLKPNKC